jgi:diadenosine tetraphosphate (Ap4A) HIT family hydrolase
MTTSDCPFCRKITGLADVPESEIVWRFPHSVAFLGQWQFYNGYCVLVSRRHATELSGLDDDERRGYLDEMCVLAKAMELGLRPHKLNYELLGNQVPHLHWHLFPRYLEDPERLKPVWLELERKADRPQELESGPRGRAAVVAILRDQLKRLNAPIA